MNVSANDALAAGDEAPRTRIGGESKPRRGGSCSLIGVAAAAATPRQRAVRWDAETRAIEDLNSQASADLGWELYSANDINDARQ